MSTQWRLTSVHPTRWDLRIFQQPETLRQLLSSLNDQRRKPLFIKLPPYLETPTIGSEQKDMVLSLVGSLRRAGRRGRFAWLTPGQCPRFSPIGGRGGWSSAEDPSLRTCCKWSRTSRQQVGSKHGNQRMRRHIQRSRRFGCHPSRRNHRPNPHRPNLPRPPA